jgi:hypothetical protein
MSNRKEERTTFSRKTYEKVVIELLHLGNGQLNVVNQSFHVRLARNRHIGDVLNDLADEDELTLKWVSGFGCNNVYDEPHNQKRVTGCCYYVTYCATGRRSEGW